MSKSDLDRVGRIVKAQGLKGEVLLYLYVNSTDWLEQLAELTFLKDLANESSAVKYGLESYRKAKDGLVLKLEGVNDRNEAELLRGLWLKVPHEYFVSRPGDSLYLHELIGFRVELVGGKAVGIVKGFSSNGAQDIICIEESSGNLAEVPLVKPFISELNFSDRLLKLDLPAGLLSDE